MPASSSLCQVNPNSYRFWLVALLAGATILRLFLVSHGGQYFFGDEIRHDRSVALYDAVRSGDLPTIKIILSRPDHAWFTVLGAGITGLQHLSTQFTRWSDWQRHPENEMFTFWIGAAWLAMFSVLNIWLVYRIARRAGAGPAEAGWAALLMACSNTGFYYSRHFLPYDAALSCALVAIWVGLSPRRSLLCGLFAGATYNCYNGYWYLVPVVLALHFLWGDLPVRSRVTRFAIAAFGAALALALPISLGLAIEGQVYWKNIIEFSTTVSQGLYREGWSLPWEYFWHSEGILGLAVCIIIASALIAARRTAVPIDRRMWFWLAAAGMSYGWLVLFSVGLEKFVVYARSVKPLVPFLCLAGGWAAARLLAKQERLSPFAMAACVLAACVNFLPHFGFIFPTDVELRVRRELGNAKHALAVSGCIYPFLYESLPPNRPDLVLVNAQLLYPVRAYVGYPAGTVIFSLPHPLSYPPFQYESHTPRERTLLRENDISIRLIRLSNPEAQPDEPPVPQRWTPSDKPDGRH